MVESAKAVNAARALVGAVDDPSVDRLLEIRRRVTAVNARLRDHHRLEEEQLYLWPDIPLAADERAKPGGRIRRARISRPMIDSAWGGMTRAAVGKMSSSSTRM
jgi:hypothetical protein